MVRLISKQSRTSAGLKLTKLFDIDDFSVAKDSGNALIIIIYCYLIIIMKKNVGSENHSCTNCSGGLRNSAVAIEGQL